MTKILPYLILAYVFGGIPFGLIVARAVRGVDIRRLGSGNIGATNVLRVIGWKAGVLVLILDAIKGFLPVMLVMYLFPGNYWGAILAALAAVLGHSFSIFLRFTGGRSVAVGLGVMLALSWKAGLSGFVLAIALMAIFRYVSLGSIVGAASLPVFGWLYGDPGEYIGFSAFAAALIIIRHVPNIKRLLAGTESKLGQKVVAQPLSSDNDDHTPVEDQ